MNIHVDVNRVVAELDQLAAFSGGEPPGVTRVVFTPADLRARHVRRLPAARHARRAHTRSRGVPRGARTGLEAHRRLRA